MTIISLSRFIGTRATYDDRRINNDCCHLDNHAYIYSEAMVSENTTPAPVSCPGCYSPVDMWAAMLLYVCVNAECFINSAAFFALV